ncbi:patched domain-containing protein 3-like [Denticeps clupeoides]|nr:patched domain-containing protein 3-like [Denticeps clupeoides]
MARTDCVQKPLALLFHKLGHLVGSYPVCFLTVPVLLSAGLGGGLYLLGDREDNDIERQFTPTAGRSKETRRFVQENFPHDASMFSVQRLDTEGIYASIIITSSDEDNILKKTTFEEIVDLNGKIRSISVTSSDKVFKYEGLCTRTRAGCLSNDILDIIEHQPEKIEQVNISFPVHEVRGRPAFLGAAVGGVDRSKTQSLRSARAVRLFFFLKDTDISRLWLRTFHHWMSSNRTYQQIRVSHFTSLSRQEEFEEHTPDGIPLFSITYALVIVFSVMSCLRLENVRNKVWVASVGVLSAGLAVLSSFGLMLYIGVPFVITVVNSPFLILGIGVDDMFIMISNWQQTAVSDPVPKRMADTYKEAAMSITITTVTDIIGFYVGLMTDFRSVQAFCLYTSTSIFFCYLYNVTFFGAFLALNGRREGSNRHWLTCAKVPTERPAGSSATFALCCVGGAFDEATGREKEQPVNHFFKQHYGPLLTKPWTKACVLVLYVGYLAAALYGCLHIQDGTDLRNLAADDSYLISYYEDEKKHFTTFGPTVMVIVGEEFPYWDPNRTSQLAACLNRFKELSFVSQDIFFSWLDIYQEFSRKIGFNINDEHDFMNNLSFFFKVFPELRLDVNVTASKVQASRFFIQTMDVANASMEIKVFNGLRDTAKSCPATRLLVYHPVFVLFDQYDVIKLSTIQSITLTAAVMLLTSLLLIPNPLCSLWVTLSIGSVMTGVTGFMALWEVNLDTISMIILVVCVGFTVDFSAHISYAFVSSEKETANEKVTDALFHLGYPVVQGAVSTIIGVVVLATSKNYIYRTVFKIVFLVMMLGLVHSVTFIPVFLTLFSCGSTKCQKTPNHLVSQGLQAQKHILLSRNVLIYDNRAVLTDTISTQQTYVIQYGTAPTRAWLDPDCP